MTEFTPLQSLAGGALIGIAAVLLLALNGRIAGITGILGGLVPPYTSPGSSSPGTTGGWLQTNAWRIAFLIGMVAAPLAYSVAVGGPIDFQSPASWPALLVGGIIVGIGVSYGSGCTSGHGVCGLARFSHRSLAAVATFMATTGATVFIVRHVLGG